MDDTFGFIVGLLIYAFVSFCIYRIAGKTGEDNTWFAFVPILQLVLLLSIAGKPIWWILFFFIPLLNLVFFVITCMGVAQARGKAAWLGLLMVIPIANVGVLAYLAFTD